MRDPSFRRIVGTQVRRAAQAPGLASLTLPPCCLYATDGMRKRHVRPRVRPSATLSRVLRLWWLSPARHASVVSRTDVVTPIWRLCACVPVGVWSGSVCLDAPQTQTLQIYNGAEKQQREVTWKNTNELLKHGYCGIKTGVTPATGHLPPHTHARAHTHI